MRKIILSVCICLIALFASAAQLSTTSGKFYTTYPGIGYVFIFNGLNNSSAVVYDSIATNVKWYRFSDPATPVYTGVSSFDQLEDNKGYILEEENGNKITFWVLDYQLYKPVKIEPDVNSTSQCKDVTLLFTIPTMSYKSLAGTSYNLERDFNVKYKQYSWNGTVWAPGDTTKTFKAPATQISVPVPYGNTVFTLYGDQYAMDLGIKQDSVSSSLYVNHAVKSHLIANVANRTHDRNNEGDAPSATITPINFSAPIDVQFQSNANEATQYYNWGIYKDKKLIINRTDKDNQYTFTEMGTYNVKLTVSDATCSFSDSLTVIVTESEIFVPNVFTPNGDGFNDEFRVAYKSLLTFQCWVYNRWGRKVYYWTDPTKGWDGTINGKKATPGPYFYIIKATGSDKKVYKLKGDINLLRGAGN